MQPRTPPGNRAERIRQSMIALIDRLVEVVLRELEYEKRHSGSPTNLRSRSSRRKHRPESN